MFLYIDADDSGCATTTTNYSSRDIACHGLWEWKKEKKTAKKERIAC